MAEQGGPPQPGYNPNAVGATGPQPNAQSRALGVLPDANVGTGMTLNNLGALKGNVPGGVFSDKGTGFKDKMQQGLGIRTRAQFSGFEAIQAPPVGGDHTSVYGDGSGGGSGNATYDQVYGAGQTIYQNGAVHMGFTPESVLGTMASPATPGISRSREQGRGGGFGI